MKIFSAIRNHPFAFSVIFLLAAFCFSHLPFFLWMDLPEVLPDTFDYFNLTDILLHRNISDIGIQPVEIPLGYPLFLLFTSTISGKLTTVVILQSLVHLLSCIYLAYVCCKYYRQAGALVAVALGIYLANDFTIRWDTAIYSESLYSSSLIILSALLIASVNKNSILACLLLGIWLFVPEFLRPNGVYVYFIIPVLFIYFFVHRESIAKYFSIIAPALLLNIAWAAFNVKAYGAFIPGNFIRFSKIHIIAAPPANKAEVSQSLKIPSDGEKMKEYMTLPGFPQFYYSLWITRYEKMYVYHQAQDSTYKMYDWSTPIPISLRTFVYKEFYSPNDKFSGIYQHLKEHNGIRGIWLSIYQLWYKADEILLRNRLLFILFVLVSIFALYKWIATGLGNPVYMVITVLAGLHILSIFVVAFTHPTTQLRYTQVSEFIIYVTFALTPLLFREKNTLHKYA